MEKLGKQGSHELFQQPLFTDVATKVTEDDVHIHILQRRESKETVDQGRSYEWEA